MPYNSAYTAYDDETEAGQRLASQPYSRMGQFDDATVSAATTGTMGQELALGEVLQMRALQNENSFRIRARKAADQTLQQEQEEMNGFTERVQNLNPGDLETNAKFFQEELIKNPNNKRMQEAVAALSAGDTAVHTARSNQFKSNREKDAYEYYDKKQTQLEQVEDLKIESSLSEWKTHKSQAETKEYVEGETDYATIANGASRFAEKDMATAELLTKFAVDGKRGLVSKDRVKEIAELSQHYGNSHLLEEIDAVGLNRAKSSVTAADRLILKGKSGISLIDLDKDQREEALSRLTDRDGNPDYRAQDQTRQALGYFDSYKVSANARDAFREGLQKVLSSPPDENDPAAVVEHEKQIAVLAMKGRILSGVVEKGMKDAATEVERRKAARDAAKDSAEIANKGSLIESREGKLEVAKEGVNIKRKTARDKQESELFKALLSGKKNPKPADVESAKKEAARILDQTDDAEEGTNVYEGK